MRTIIFQSWNFKILIMGSNNFSKVIRPNFPFLYSDWFKISNGEFCGNKNLIWMRTLIFQSWKYKNFIMGSNNFSKVIRFNTVINHNFHWDFYLQSTLLNTNPNKYLQDTKWSSVAF